MSNERKSSHGIVGMGIRNCRHGFFFFFFFLLGVIIITLVIIN